MLFDTDILIWVLRGNLKAVRLIQNSDILFISTVTYMELLQGARDKKEIKAIKDFIKAAGLSVLPLTENIGHRSSIYMEEYCLKTGMCLADAMIAATASENHLVLCTGNRKHYRVISELELQIFKP